MGGESRETYRNSDVADPAGIQSVDFLACSVVSRHSRVTVIDGAKSRHHRAVSSILSEHIWQLKSRKHKLRTRTPTVFRG